MFLLRVLDPGTTWGKRQPGDTHTHTRAREWDVRRCEVSVGMLTQSSCVRSCVVVSRLVPRRSYECQYLKNTMLPLQLVFSVPSLPSALTLPSSSSVCQPCKLTQPPPPYRPCVFGEALQASKLSHPSRLLLVVSPPGLALLGLGGIFWGWGAWPPPLLLLHHHHSTTHQENSRNKTQFD